RQHQSLQALGIERIDLLGGIPSLNQTDRCAQCHIAESQRVSSYRLVDDHTRQSCLGDFHADSLFPVHACIRMNGSITAELADVVTRGHVWTAPGRREDSSLCSNDRSSHLFGVFARYS